MQISEIAESIYKYTIEIDCCTMPHACYAIRLGIPGEELTRPYSPVRATGTTVECIIKIYPHSTSPNRKMFTPYLSKLSVSDRLKVLWYTPKHSIQSIICKKNRRVCMLSAGTGITPMMQVLEHANESAAVQKFVTISVSSGPSTVILKSKDEYPSVDLHVENIFVGKNANSRDSGLDKVRNKIEDVLSESKDTMFLVCGPDSFVTEVAGDRKGAYGGILQKLSVPENMCIKF